MTDASNPNNGNKKVRIVEEIDTRQDGGDYNNNSSSARH